MQAGYSELDFLRSRRRSGTVSSLISKFAASPAAAAERHYVENRRHTIVGFNVPPSACRAGQSARNRSNSGAFLTQVLARKAAHDRLISDKPENRTIGIVSTPLSANSVTLKEVTNTEAAAPFATNGPLYRNLQNNNSNEKGMRSPAVAAKAQNVVIKPTICFQTERKVNESAIADLKRRTDQRKADLSRVQSMPNGGTSGAAAAREKFLRKIGEDPNK